jgi:hypothetical protein
MHGKSIFFLALFLVFLAGVFPAKAEEQPVTISLPAEILRQTISDALPIPIETKNHVMEGSIVVDSLDKLQVLDKSIFIEGVVSGRDLAMTADIGGQNIKMKLGSVRLPVTCELFLRFDKQQKILFVKPVFPKPKKGQADDAAEVLQPLLASLGNREYPVAFDDIEPFLFKLGERTIPVKLTPTDIQTLKGILVVKMIPRVSAAR